MIRQTRTHHEAKKSKVLFALIPFLIIIAAGAVALYFGVIKPQSKETGAAIVSKTSASRDSKGITLNNLKKTDSAFCDDHYVSENSYCGFTSPYGYYYFDTRQYMDGNKPDKKQSLLFYDYKSHKSSEVNCRVSKDSADNSDSTRNLNVSATWDGGAFYKDKLFLITNHDGRPDDGFDLYRGNPDGTDLKKIYTSSYRTHGESVYCNNKVYFSLDEHLAFSGGQEENRPNESKIVCVDLNTLQETTIFSKKGFDATIALKGYYNNTAYFAYGENIKKLDRQNATENDYEKNIKEDSMYSLDLNTKKAAMITPKVFSGGVFINGKYMLNDECKGKNTILKITNLENNEKSEVTLYKNTRPFTGESDALNNTYQILDGKIIYYTKANEMTKDRNIYDIASKQITKMTPPNLNEGKLEVSINIEDVTSDGFVCNMRKLDTAKHQVETNLCYISKGDYYAGKLAYIDFDY